ncbi:hypothetical protein [Conexibacter woesei]|uniref:hypothetical protein n=1 Tax=Conexibacter woesei TaxID=191495 RepID=UPI00040DEA7B|nr:hypothetical protein [Conexibacter woesei]
MSAEFFLDGLERDLVEAAARSNAVARGAAPSGAATARRTGGRAGAAARGRRRPPMRTLAVAAALVTVGAASAAGGTLLALRGAVIPTASDTPPEQVAAPGTARVASFRLADPGRGKLPWTVRVARSSKGGLVCSTVGQVDATGRFGLVGNDGRFRVFDAGVSDSCGAPQGKDITLIGARIFDAPRDADARTVVSGVGGANLRSVTLALADGTAARALPLDHGTFAAVLRGYPEDHGIRVTLRFAGGHRETRAFGIGPNVVAAPNGGGAWRLENVSVASSGSVHSALAGASCAYFQRARISNENTISPQVCARLKDGRGWFFAARRLSQATVHTTLGPVPTGHWPRGAAPVTALWGQAGSDVRRVSYTVPGGGAPERPLALQRNGGVLLILPPSVDPDAVVLHLHLADGRVIDARGDTNLIDTNKP